MFLWVIGNWKNVSFDPPKAEEIFLAQVCSERSAMATCALVELVAYLPLIAPEATTFGLIQKVASAWGGQAMAIPATPQAILPAGCHGKPALILEACFFLHVIARSDSDVAIPRLKYTSDGIASA